MGWVIWRQRRDSNPRPPSRLARYQAALRRLTNRPVEHFVQITHRYSRSLSPGVRRLSPPAAIWPLGRRSTCQRTLCLPEPVDPSSGPGSHFADSVLAGVFTSALRVPAFPLALCAVNRRLRLLSIPAVNFFRAGTKKPAEAGSFRWATCFCATPTAGFDLPPAATTVRAALPWRWLLQPTRSCLGCTGDRPRRRLG